METKIIEIFREISRKCVEAYRRFESNGHDRDNLNDAIMKIGAYYGISLFDRIWFNNHSEAKNSPELIFATALHLSSNELDIVILRNTKFIGGFVIDEEGVVSFNANYDKNGIALIHEEDILKALS